MSDQLDSCNVQCPKSKHAKVKGKILFSRFSKLYHFRKDMNNVIRPTIPIGQILKSLKNALSKYSQNCYCPLAAAFLTILSRRYGWWYFWCNGISIISTIYVNCGIGSLIHLNFGGGCCGCIVVCCGLNRFQTVVRRWAKSGLVHCGSNTTTTQVIGC